MLICALRSVNFTWAQAQVSPGVASLVPMPPPFFVLPFLFSICSVFIRIPKNKKRHGNKASYTRTYLGLYPRKIH